MANNFMSGKHTFLAETKEKNSFSGTLLKTLTKVILKVIKLRWERERLNWKESQPYEHRE